MRSSLEHQILDRLPSPVPLAAQLLDRMRSSADLARSTGPILERDPALTARILRHANEKNACHSLDAALHALHPTTLRMLIPAVQVESPAGARNLDHGEYWRTAWCTAVAARALSRRFAPDQVPVAFTAGLLDSVDRFAASRPGAEGAAWIGDAPRLLRTWGLPEEWCDRLAASRSLEGVRATSDARHAGLVRVLHLARSFGRPKDFDPSQLHAILQEVFRTTEYDLAVTQQICREVRREYSAGASSLDTSSATEEQIARLRAAATEELQVSLLGATMDLRELGQRVALAGERATELSRHNEELEKLATLDGLTGLANRFLLDQQIDALSAERTTERAFRAVLMIDLDHFKSINDQHGHEAGDQVLRAVAGILSELCDHEPQRLAGRYGGEEFCIVMRCSEPEEPVVLAEELRGRLAASPIPLASGVVLRPTASIGVAVAGPEQRESGASLQARADECLYESKRAGRNRVTARDLVTA